MNQAGQFIGQIPEKPILKTSQHLEIASKIAKTLCHSRKDRDQLLPLSQKKTTPCSSSCPR